jgi:hypothetical protein
VTAARRDVVRRGETVFTRAARSTALERDEHSLARYQLGCRCPKCRRARRAYDRGWFATRQILRGGVVNRRVPAARAVDAIGALRARGWSLGKVAAECGCHEATLARIVRAHRQGAQVRCWSMLEGRLVDLAAR